MKIFPVTVGPIVGATNGRSVRLWGRGELQPEEDGPKRCFGIARLRSQASGFGAPQYFKMNPNFDMTGVTVFKDLRPETAYTYQIGYFFAELELDEVAEQIEPDWSELPAYNFVTASEDMREPRAFIVGSCRYLLRLFGLDWFDSRGDKTFRSIVRQLNEGQAINGLVMMGDQIYADDLNILSADRTLQEFYGRYRATFSQPYVRELMSRVSTYMIMDDHEVKDNWPASSSAKDWVTLYPVAMHAYQTYQVSHSPVFTTAGARIVGVPEYYWYTFRDGCADFFVTDTRNERSYEGDIEDYEIVNRQQMDALKKWLNDGSGRVKFVVSATTVFPDTKLSNEDKWGGFPGQRSELLDFIRRRQIRRVVFLSGDVHASFSAELVSADAAPGFKIIQVISSAFFWPYPHSTRHDFLVEQEIVSNRSGAVYEVVNAGDIYPTDNFTRLTVDLNQLRVSIYERKGRLLSERVHMF